MNKRIIKTAILTKVNVKLILILLLSNQFLSKSQTQIPSNFFGINAWMPDAVGVSTPSISPGNTITAAPGYSFNYNVNGLLYSYSATAVSGLGIKMMRYGGTLNDINLPTIAQYSAFVTLCNAYSITPIVQIPFMNYYWFNYVTGSANITTTASASAYTNNIVTAIVNTVMPMGVKYYSIGNEPDLWNSIGFSVTVTQSLSAAEIAAYFKVASKTIKSIDPTAIVIGPDLASAHTATNDYAYQFIDATNLSANITGTIPGMSPTRYYCDIYAFHRYGFNGTQTPTAVINQPSTTFSTELTAIRNRISTNSSNPNLKIAVTELNVDYNNAAANSYSDPCSNGFLAGQWLSEMYAVALNSPTGAPVAFMTPWSVHESSGNQGAGDQGFINGTNTTTPQYRSTYHHTKMMAEGFSGGFFYMGVTTNTNVKAFSSKDCSHITNFFMNQDNVNSHTLIISQTSVTPVGAADVSVALNMPSSWSTKTISIGPLETQMFIYDACGATKKHYTYSQSTYSTYPTPTLATSNATRFCSCTKSSISSYPHYNLRCASVTGTQAIHYSSVTLTSSLTLNDSAYISGNLTVPRGYKLTINNAEIVMDDNAKIVVQTGGQLVISGSNLHSCTGSSTGWNGIEITGDNTDASQVSITNSRITDAVVAIKALQVQSLTVTGNYFNNGAQAIRLSGCKGFDIEDNDIISYTCAINTNTCLSAASSIKNNMFFEQDTAIYFDSDNHGSLDFNCNGFIDYNSYGIFSHSATLKSQGSTANGAGNEFLSNSGYTNHQINHSTNAINYYTDPSFSFTLAGSSAGYSVTTFTASADAACYSVSPRMAHLQTIAKNYTGDSKLLNCFPNPANNTVTFSYLLENKVRNASIIITDLFGRRVKEITLPLDTEMTNEDLNGLSNGIYFYTLFTDGRAISSRKIIISK